MVVTDRRRHAELIDAAVEDITGERNPSSVRVLWARQVIERMVTELLDDDLDAAYNTGYDDGVSEGYGIGWSDAEDHFERESDDDD